MASDKEYEDAIARVKSRSFSRTDLELTKRAGSQAGVVGSQAREALRIALEDLEIKAKQPGWVGNNAREMLKYT